MRLLDHLKQTGLSNREARQMMSTGKVFLGDVPTMDGGREVDPTEVSIRPNAPKIVLGRDVVLLWRDAHMAVVIKPSGMLSVPAPRRRETNVLAEVGRLLGTCLPVHRLDEGTSGVMLVALDAESQQGLKAQLEVHSVERRYLALVAGILPESPARIASELVRDRGDGKRGTKAGEEGRPAVTHVATLQAFGRSSLVEATLETGRTHQVRIHLSEQGCPLFGDPLYAPRGVAGLFPRVALHSSAVGFEHPRTGAKMRFQIPLADDLEHLRRDLASRRS